MAKVLHVLSQRPSLTGSGITLDALVRCAARAGWDQAVVVGVPAHDPRPAVGGLDPSRVEPLVFGGKELPFPLPGMSDVMPYESSRFSALTPARLDAYRSAWRKRLAAVIRSFRPHVIHSHHVWIASSLVKETAPGIPTVIHCHATGLRQMELCPHLAPEVRSRCARSDRFAVLRRGHVPLVEEILGVKREGIHVVGAGFRDDIFNARGRKTRPGRGPGRSLLYPGKLSAAKGLPWLLDAVERLRSGGFPDIELHVAGGGAGPEAEALERRMEGMGRAVVLHGRLDQEDLAALMRGCDVCVLPSLYEGVPLVLVEALACGCRLVATRLPGVVEELVPALGPALELVDLPRLEGPDTPATPDLPRFAGGLSEAAARALAAPPIEDPFAFTEGALERFTWSAVFERVERIWFDLAGPAAADGAPGP